MRRYAALTSEGLLLAAVVLLTGFLTLPATRAATSGALTLPPLPSRVFSFCLVFGIVGVYFTWCWTGGRRTLPMKTWRMALVRTDGRVVQARAAVMRYLCAWIGPLAALVAYEFLHAHNLGAHAAWWLALGYAWPAVDPERQFLHDRLAGTRLVMAPAHPSSAAPEPLPR
jgi:uncharacterized RDD family membrane protein YckC